MTRLPHEGPGPPDSSEDSSEPFQRLDRCVPYAYTRREYARRFVWHFVQATVYRWLPRRAYGARRAFLRGFGATLGDNVRIRPRVYVFHPWLLEIGEWCSVGEDVVIYNLGPVTIGRHTAVSHGAYLCAGTHDHTRPDLPLLRPPIRLGHGVWVAAQAFIGPGVTVGDNSVIGARAVVTRDVPPGVVAAGNPARVVKPRVMNERGRNEASAGPSGAPRSRADAPE